MKKNFEQLKEFAGELFQNGFSVADVYTHILMEFYGTPYVWGGSSPQGSDCSGSVCAAMSLATGKNVRVTADELYRRYFTEDVTNSRRESTLCAASFLDGSGRAVHVAGLCEGMYMNVSRFEPNKAGNFRTAAELRRLYPHLLMLKRGMKI